MNKKWLMMIFFSFWATPSSAVEFISLKQEVNNKELQVTPKFEVKVSQKVIDAIDNGIVITFVYQAKLYDNIEWWFDDLIDHKIATFEVRYFSLSNQFQLNNINKNIEQSFVTLPQLLIHMGQQTTFVFAENPEVDYLETRIFLDKQALPSIMQLPNVFDADWNLNSDWQAVNLEPTVNSSPNP